MSLVATCHCGATYIEVAVPPHDLTECNCSFCFKRGALWAYYPPGEVTVHADSHKIAYTSNPQTHTHYHCGACGCSTHSQLACTWTNDGPDFDQPRIAINARLFDDFDIAALPVAKLDGRSEW